MIDVLGVLLLLIAAALSGLYFIAEAAWRRWRSR